MKLLLTTAHADDIAWSAAHGMLDGVITSPRLLADEPVEDARAHLLDLCRLVHGPIFATVQSVDSSGAYRDGRELAKLSDQIVVQLPFVEDTMAAMRRLSAEGIRVSSAHVFNAAQALIAVRAGASSVMTAVDRLDAIGHDGVAVIRAIRAAFDACGAECDVIAAKPSSAAQFAACAAAGADAAAFGSELARALLVHPLTDRAVDQFLGDVTRLRRSWPST